MNKGLKPLEAETCCCMPSNARATEPHQWVHPMGIPMGHPTGIPMGFSPLHIQNRRTPSTPLPLIQYAPPMGLSNGLHPIALILHYPVNANKGLKPLEAGNMLPLNSSENTYFAIHCTHLNQPNV